MSRSSATRRENALLDGLVALVCLLAFVHGVQSTSRFEWPGEVDKARDIGQAQTMLDGDWLGDSQYLGERLWYNPLTPTLVAVIAWALRLPVYLVYTQAGAYLNVLVPLMMYWLVGRWLGRRAGVVAVLLLVLVPPGADPTLPFPSYSPWLFSRNLSPAWFALTLLAYTQARLRQSRRWFVAAGGLLGVTFLAHTAPALILGCIMALTTLLDLRHVPSRRLRRLIDLGAALLVALIVSVPLVYSIVGRYQLRVLNAAPGRYVVTALELANAGTFIVDNFLTRWPFWLALLGLVALWRERHQRPAVSLIMVWVGSAAVLLAYSYVWQLARTGGVDLPSPIPGYHYLFYLWLAQDVLAAYGLIRLCGGVGGWLARRWRQPDSSWELGLLGVSAALILAGYAPAYSTRADFVEAETLAADFSQDVDTINAYHWVRANTQPVDVFLSSDRLSTYLVTPAGRKIVAGDRWFSNPYVDWKVRATDRDTLFGQLINGQAAEFCALAQHYRVTYVTAGSNLAKSIEAANLPVIAKVLTSGRIGVYRVACAE